MGGSNVSGVPTTGSTLKPASNINIKKGSPKTRPCCLLLPVFPVVLGSVIEVRVRLLLSVRVLRARVVPLLDAPSPQFLL